MGVYPISARDFSQQEKIRRHRLRATNRSPHKRPAVFSALSEMKKPDIRLDIEPLEEGGYVATSPDAPGLVAEAQTIEELTELAYALCHDIAACYRDHGDPLPTALENL